MRHWWQLLSLKRKLLLIIQSINIFTLLLASVVFMMFVWINVRRSLAWDVTATADMIANNSTAALAFNDPAGGREVLQALKAHPYLTDAWLYDKNKRLFASFNSDRIAPISSPDGIRFRGNKLIVVRPVLLNGKRIGTICVENGLGMLYERIRVYGITTLVVLIGVILLS
jgi:hypothetical protein